MKKFPVKPKVEETEIEVVEVLAVASEDHDIDSVVAEDAEVEVVAEDTEVEVVAEDTEVEVVAEDTEVQEPEATNVKPFNSPSVSTSKSNQKNRGRK